MSIFEYDKEEEEKKLRRAEFEAGYESAKREMALEMTEEGEPIEKIARILKMDENTIRKWRNETK